MVSYLSVVVLTLNEARNIGDCLASASLFADEFVVFDSYSQDTTCDIARKAGAKVVQRRFDNYALQRNSALESASGNWVFFLDADERATEEVGSEIRVTIERAKTDASSPVLFWIPRKNYIFGRWIRHTGWSPDYQPRLMLRDRARFDTKRPVHELVIAEGVESFLEAPLLHFNYDSFAQFRAKQSVYTRIEARMLFEEGIRTRRRGLVGQPLREFYRRFIALEGYKDGAYGLLLSTFMAYYAFVRQQTLSKMWQENAK